MKKMGFTKSKWLSVLGQFAFLVLFTLCFAGLQSANAQIVMKYTKSDTTCTVKKLDACSGDVTDKSTLFTDDGGNDGNYVDLHMRRDTVEICPKDKWHRVKIVFTDFDLEEGDTLFAFNATKKELRAAGPAALATGASSALGAGSGTGVGVASAFGGWIDATCDPLFNPSGCLTFIFATDGDNRKGSGWDAWVDCGAREVKLSDVTIADVKLKCTDEAWAEITIPAPTVKACGATLTGASDNVFARVKNQHGEICADLMLSKSMTGLPGSALRNFAIGQYSVEYKLKSDTTKTLTRYFSVQAPTLVCNDDITIPMGAACMIVITPDDVLEQHCPVNPGVLDYKITITVGSGKTKKTVSGANPVLTKGMLDSAGVSICGGIATIRVERTYYAGGIPTPVECNNGEQTLYCETKLNIVDESKPWVDVTSAPDTLIACDTTGLAKLLSARGLDNCDTDVPVTYTVTLSENDPCFRENGKPDTTTATVVFTAVDDCGNVGTATKVITMIRPDIDLYVAKTKNIQVECDEDAKIPAPGVKIGIWKNNKFEVKDTVELSTEKYICGYILTSEDEDIPSTDCGKKKYRYWYALDWCDASQGPKRIDTTFIENTDTKAPVFHDEEKDQVTAARNIELGHFDCTYDITKNPKPKAWDNCDENPEVRLHKVFRIEDGQNWEIPNSGWTALDCDSFRLMYVVTDECHEQLKEDTTRQIVVIKDVTKPSALCVDQLNVSLPNEWGARVYAKDVDAGSYDACGIKSILIRIKDSGDEWAEYVELGCEYVHPDLQIEMQVLDNKYNENICWLDIVVEDKINPICNPLEDKTDTCDKYHNGELGASTDANEDNKFDDDEWTALEGDLQALYNAKFGSPDCEDNLKTTAGCGELTTEEQYQLIEWPCGEIEIRRRYRAVDWSGNGSTWATQNIKITYQANWKITFPADWEGECGDSAPEEQITLLNGACDLLGYEVTEKQFDIPGDACFKIERTYHVINWCKYVAGDPATEIARVEGEHGISEGLMITSEGNEDKGYFTFVQVLKVHDQEAPVVTVTDPEPCINGIEFDALPYGEEDQTLGYAPYECDEPKTWTATATDCSSKINWIGKLYDASTGELVHTVESNELTYVVSNKDSYYAEFWAYDNCGNSAGERGADVKFWDCKKPTPYVLNGIAVEIMQTGMSQIWATDLNQNSFDNCTDQPNLDLRIWHASLGDAPTDDAGVQALGKVITLNCLYIGTQVVNIYVIDEEGNWDYAATYVIIQDNMGACQDFGEEEGMVAGAIVNPNGENVEGVTVSVNGATQKSMTTGADGHFAFNLETGADYTLTPEKDINPLNGVSTFDLVLISKHILGITTFDSPYKYIAADVNKSGSITAFDMVQLRQLILNITSEFPSNDSWRFVDAQYNFTSANPAAENFSEVSNINNLNANMENMDFVGVKVGDVNGNALASSLLGSEVRNTNGILNFNVADRFVEAGQTVNVEFTSANIASAQGYQFTMNFAGLELNEVVEGVAKAANFNTNLVQRGVLTTSWNGEATATDVLFTLNFTATADGLLSDLVSVNSDLTAAEAYSTAGELLDVKIEFTTTAIAGFELGQNTPNPFKGETVIGFNLPTAGAATLKVMDVQGRVLKLVEGEFAKGYNTVTINAKELGATGVLHYQLESADQIATKKMIIIE